jgi:hypothetical protein
VAKIDIKDPAPARRIRGILIESLAPKTTVANSNNKSTLLKAILILIKIRKY